MTNQISTIQSISYNDIQVSFSKDAFLNATAIAEQFGKRVGNYLQNERTSDYINAIVEYLAETGNPVTDKNQLVIVKKGGNDKKAQGTWLHPKLAIDFARWLNPKFAVWCDMQIEKILNFNNPAITEQRQTISVEQQSAIRQAIAKRCKSDSIHYQTIYTALQKHFDIPRYTELLASDFDECMALIESIELSLPQITHNQSYLTQQDALTLAKVMDYARLYAEFAPKVGTTDGQVAVATLYNRNTKNDDDGFFVCYRPRYKDDIDKAMTLFRNIAQNSLLST